MEKILTKLYDLEISIERLKGLKDTLEQLIADAEVEDIKINALVVSLEREIDEADKIEQEIIHEAQKQNNKNKE